MTRVTEQLIKRLIAAVGPSHVLTDPDVVAGYAVDWTGRWRGPTPAVVRPGSVGEVADVLRACREANTAVVPQGGNTGLVGGGVPRDGEVILSLVRLDAVGPVDAAAGQISAGAGVTLADVQRAAGDVGMTFPIDLAARDSATVGGMIATNAGGVHVLRYGTMRAQVVGIEAVLASGAVVRRMAGLVKDNSGYDLTGLCCGSEGTIAVVTEARLRLVAQAAHRVGAVIGLRGLDDAVALLGRLRGIASLEAVEVMFADGIEIVLAHAGLAWPLSPTNACVLLVECAGSSDPTEELGHVLADADVLIEASAVASDGPGRARLWAMRERHTEAVNALGVPHKLDVTLPLSGISAFEREVRHVVTAVAPMAQTVIWGHLGDGNLHVNIIGPAADDDGVDDAVLRLVAAYGGSISAEHGIGVAKRRWLSLTRSDADLSVMRAIKRALDPSGLLNPGVLFAPEDR